MARKILAFAAPPELSEWVETQAKREGRTVSDWLRRMLVTLREKGSKRKVRR